MWRTRGTAFLIGALFFSLIQCVFCSRIADASEEFRVVAPEGDRVRAIRSVCDKVTGNLIYQSESKYVSPVDFVLGGCPVEPYANASGVWRLVTPDWGRFKAIYAFCDLPAGNLIYQSESGWVSPIRIVPGGCAVPPLPALPPLVPTPTAIPTQSPPSPR